MNHTKKSRLPLYIGIPVILLLIFLRFGLYFLKSDGFSGLSLLLPVLLLCFILFALCTAASFIGLLIYFLRRSEIKTTCPACGHRISLKAKYCEECGTYIENREDNGVVAKQETHHLKFIVTGVISMVLMLVCLTGFIVSAAAGNGVNTNVTSNDRVWNLGVISMNSNTYLNGVLNLDFRSASDGFVEEQDMMIMDADTQRLYADISCKTVPEGATLVLWLVQDEVVKSVDVTNLSEPLEYPLNEFENGEVHVRLQINGVEDTVAEIYVQ